MLTPPPGICTPCEIVRVIDGDTVEVMTNATQVPRKDWLEFVVTGKARSRIRQAIRSADTARSRELGRDILERELRKAGMSLARLLEGGGLTPAVDKYGRGSLDELLGKMAAYVPHKSIFAMKADDL